MAKKNTISWPLAPAPESKDHFTLKQQYELYRRQVDAAPKSGTRSAPRSLRALRPTPPELLRGEPYFDTINTANEQKG